MIRPPFADESLNAYVDGELSPDEAAELARHAARDPALAARIARFHRLKAAVAGIAPPVTPPLIPSRRGPVARWHLPLALAACLALAVGAAALWRAPAAAPSAEVALHDTWAASGAEGAAEAPVWLAAVIEASGLRLVRRAQLSSRNGTTSVHYGFVGTNRCRLSFFEMPAPRGPDSALTLLVQGNLRSARWQAGDQAYLVIARDMDATRFAAIVAALSEATNSRTVPEEEQIALLRAARQRCLT
jgi:hypothetical protein